ncbi:MAG: hypothetical protein A07HR60_02128 [uncultured archaeon A07HR60]|nr:MAG: hypothetical protein A07HR60_02128 [uncultured archaeon A07HR60]
MRHSDDSRADGAGTRHRLVIECALTRVIVAHGTATAIENSLRRPLVAAVYGPISHSQATPVVTRLSVSHTLVTVSQIKSALFRAPSSMS